MRKTSFAFYCSVRHKQMMRSTGDRCDGAGGVIYLSCGGQLLLTQRRLQRTSGALTEQCAQVGVAARADMSAGVVTLVATWMLDPAACATMELGEPRLTVTA